MKQNGFPPGWDEDRVRQVLAHYEEQTEAEAVAEDEAALEDRTDSQPQPPRLLADAMLGALARWLRALDVDVTYDPALDDPELVERAVAEGRTILTRDRRLTERRLARNHLLIRSDDVAEQLRQVLAELGLRPDPDRLLGRCLRCNVPLAPLDAEAARARVPPWVARTQERFRACPECGRVYWRGTHVQRMLSRLREMGV